MKSVFCCINNLIEDKLNFIYEYLNNNHVKEFYLLVTNINKNTLSKLVSKLPNNVKIMLFLDSSSSYNLSVNDIKLILDNKKNIKILFDEFYTIKDKNLNINVVSDLIEKEDLYENIEIGAAKYEVFIIKDNKYEFDFKVFTNTKAIFISIPYLNNKNDFFLIEKNNGLFTGSHLVLKNEQIENSILFKI